MTMKITLNDKDAEGSIKALAKERDITHVEAAAALVMVGWNRLVAIETEGDKRAEARRKAAEALMAKIHPGATATLKKSKKPAVVISIAKDRVVIEEAGGKIRVVRPSSLVFEEAKAAE